MKFTEANVKTAAPPGDGKSQVIYYDDHTRGLGLRVTRSGAASWVFNYRGRGVERRLTIGRAADWPLKLARDEAHRLRRLVDLGEDPMAERHADRAAPTMRDLVERWREERAPRKRPGSLAEDEAMIKQWIDPELGNRKVADVTHPDIDRLHRKITKAGTPIRANRVASLLSRLFNLAVIWGMRPDSPVKGLEKNPEQARHRYLTPAELDRLTAALDAHKNQQAANVIRLLLLTGARRGEVLAMQWTHVDLGEPAVWTKPASAVKQGRLHRVPLNAEARELLIAIKLAASAKAAKAGRELAPWVFPAARRRNGTEHLEEIKGVWAALCETAKLADLRIHDLRHSFASLLASEGYSLPLIDALLGHSQASTTQRYAHLLDSAQRQAAERLGALVKKAGKGEVVNFPAGGKA